MRKIRRFAPPVTGEQIPAPEQQTAPVQVTIIVPHSPLAPRRRKREAESGWRLLYALLAIVIVGVTSYAVVQYVRAYAGLMDATTDLVKSAEKAQEQAAADAQRALRELQRQLDR